MASREQSKRRFHIIKANNSSWKPKFYIARDVGGIYWFLLLRGFSVCWS